MHVIAHKRLLDFGEQYPNAKKPLYVWYVDVEASQWTEFGDIQKIYGRNVSSVGDKVVVFNIKGNSYRLVVRVEYKYKCVYVRWFGTHKEYDRLDVANI
jgi:mRNA interferase HigB